jgi:hypothetical protein
LLRFPVSYSSPKLEARPVTAKGCYGLFAIEPAYAGELLVSWGGTVIHADDFFNLPPEMVRLTVQIEEELYLVTDDPDRVGPGDYVNHSCNPNSGIHGHTMLVAMRDISPGEEICFDYAMTDGSPYEEFVCACGSANCRGRVTGDDWRNPLLWERYDGYFSLYLQRRILRLKQEALLTRDTAAR